MNSHRVLPAITSGSGRKAAQVVAGRESWRGGWSKTVVAPLGNGSLDWIKGRTTFEAPMAGDHLTERT